MNVPPDWRNHIDFAQPVKLHYNFRKFWEITLLGTLSLQIKLMWRFRGVCDDQHKMREIITEPSRG